MRLPAAAVTEPRSSMGSETRMSCAVVPHASWSSRADSMVLGRQFTGLPTPEVVERNASFPDTTRTLTERQGITETLQPADDPDANDPLVERAGDERRTEARAESDARPEARAAERVGLTCVNVPDQVTLRAKPGAAPQQVDVDCLLVPEAEWSTRVDTMVLGRQLTGLPTPAVGEDEVRHPDTTVTVTERQGITETMQPAADADSIDPLIDDGRRPTERAEVDPAPASVAAGVMIPLNFACVAVAEGAAELREDVRERQMRCLLIPDAVPNLIDPAETGPTPAPGDTVTTGRSSRGDGGTRDASRAGS
ncbi:MAG: hypothetical protein ABR599_04650 [Gemmatimonadota bacterium]